MIFILIFVALFFRYTAAFTGRSSSPRGCKCSPLDSCWPIPQAWSHLNATVSGQLIRTHPLALPCYPGTEYNEALCFLVNAQWSNASFQSDSPVGLSFPINLSCPPINVTAGEKPENCSFGTSPVYAVNATRPEHVSSAIIFARRQNLRLVIKTTGHDSLARSEGAGSLEIWLRHLRTGITFQKSFVPSHKCQKSNWTGSAFTIGGGYTWNDVLPKAQAQNVVVVTGGTPSVSCIGGWMQGGGHGPSSRQFGIGADQVLEAQVVIADGSIVTASPCQNQDLFFAIRGGGPGTYGVVVSTTVKAWPTVNATVQHLAITPLTDDTTALLDTIGLLYNAYPDLNEAGYAGYGSWSLFTGYVHGLYMFDKTLQDAQEAFASTLQRLIPFNDTALNISVSYVSYPDYWTFYAAESGIEPPVGTGNGALGSRLFDRKSVQNQSVVRNMISILAGTPLEPSFNNVELVSGGQVFKDALDPYSGVNPAWRTSYFSSIVSRGWDEGADGATIEGVRRDITYVKAGAMKRLAPDTGAYMNEADRLDPEWEKDFYGVNYDVLGKIKRQRDRENVFYCPTCVGSAEWKEDEAGRLCRA